jgi:hypothetical protein
MLQSRFFKDVDIEWRVMVDRRQGAHYFLNAGQIVIIGAAHRRTFDAGNNREDNET